MAAPHRPSAPAKPESGKRRERELVQSELPAAVQAPFKPVARAYAQMPDGQMRREEAFVLPSYVNAPPPEYEGVAVANRIKTAHIFATEPVRGRDFSVATGKCLRCGKFPSAPDMLVNQCFDTRTIPEGKKVVITVNFVAIEEEGNKEASPAGHQ